MNARAWKNYSLAELVPDPMVPAQLIPIFALPRSTIMNLKRIPIPPSSNNMYATIFGKGKSWRTKSRDSRQWESDVSNWALAHADEIRQIKERLKDLKPGEVIHVDTQFSFTRERILTKQSKPKKLDTSNRIKPIHDILSKLIEIDDCYFWHGSFSKIIVARPEQEGVDITLRIAGMYG